MKIIEKIKEIIARIFKPNLKMTEATRSSEKASTFGL